MKRALVSDLTLVPSDERQLASFLRGYKHVPNSEVCQITLVRMPHVWIRMPNGWQRIQSVRGNMPDDVSWCQWVLRSALGLDRAGYDKAKKELFGQSNALNGVYKKGSEYALVYEPSQGLSRKEWAAIAAGSSIAAGGIIALGGMGLNKWRGHNTIKHSNPTPYSAPTSLSIDQIPGYSELILQSNRFDAKRTQHTDTPLQARDFDIDNFKALMSAYEQAAESMLLAKSDVRHFLYQFYIQIEEVESLIASQTPESEILKLFGPSTSFENIVTSKIWADHYKPISTFLFSRPRKSDLYNKMLVAGLFDGIYRATTNDELKKEIFAFCLADRGSAIDKRPFYEQAHQELLVLNKDKPWAVELLNKCAEPLSRSARSVWLLEQCVKRLEDLQDDLQSKLWPDTIPPKPDVDADLDALKYEYQSLIKRLKNITSEQPEYQAAQSLLAREGALINQIDRLVRRSNSLNLKRKTTNDALALFTAISRRPDLKSSGSDDDWIRDLIDTFYWDRQTYPIVDLADLQLRREQQYVNIRDLIKDGQDFTQWVQNADQKVIDTLLADQDIGQPNRDLIINLKHTPSTSKYTPN